MKLILGLPTSEHSIETLNGMSDEEKYMYGLSRPDALSYETINEFLEDINEQSVDVDSLVWFEIELEVYSDFLNYDRDE